MPLYRINQYYVPTLLPGCGERVKKEYILGYIFQKRVKKKSRWEEEKVGTDICIQLREEEEEEEVGTESCIQLRSIKREKVA